MFTDRITVALLAIAIISSIIAVSGGGYVGPAFAAKKKAVENAVTNTMLQQPSDSENSLTSPNPSAANAGDSVGTTPDTHDIFVKNLKKLSKCLTAAAADDDLTLVEVTDCYHQVF